MFELDLAVGEGEIYGFLGPNGAGKSTTIRLLLDMIRPQAGTAAIFGHDCRAESKAVHRVTGYLPGEFALDARLTGRQLLTYLGNLRGGVEWPHVESLCRALELDLDRKFGDYSRGNKQKLGVAQAFMHRPRLLILDEPTGGLDPLNQEAVLDLVRQAHRDGATVFFSSHILSEVQEVCERVGFIREGRLVRTGPVHELLAAKGHAVEAVCSRPPSAPDFESLPGVTRVEVEGSKIALLVKGDMSAVLRKLADLGVRELTSREPSLAEVFLGLYEGEQP